MCLNFNIQLIFKGTTFNMKSILQILLVAIVIHCKYNINFLFNLGLSMLLIYQGWLFWNQFSKKSQGLIFLRSGCRKAITLGPNWRTYAVFKTKSFTLQTRSLAYFLLPWNWFLLRNKSNFMAYFLFIISNRCFWLSATRWEEKKMWRQDWHMRWRPKRQWRKM